MSIKRSRNLNEVLQNRRGKLLAASEPAVKGIHARHSLKWPFMDIFPWGSKSYVK